MMKLLEYFLLTAMVAIAGQAILFPIYAVWHGEGAGWLYLPFQILTLLIIFWPMTALFFICFWAYQKVKRQARIAEQNKN